jgi:hypothetical protein
MHSYKTHVGLNVSLWDVGMVASDGKGLIVCLGVHRRTQEVTLCPVEYVQSWDGTKWVAFDYQYDQHREMPGIPRDAYGRAFVGGWEIEPERCTQHEAIDTGFKVSECRHCHIRLVWENWHWEEQA